MRSISNHIAALGIAGLVTAAALTPASAQTFSTWSNNGWYGYGDGGPLVTADVSLGVVGVGVAPYGYYGSYPAYGSGVVVEAPVAGTVDTGFYAPRNFGYRYGTCVTNEGYGRVMPCDHGGGF